MTEANPHTVARAFGTWPSPLSAEDIVTGARGLVDLQTSMDAIYWLESRPEESGRVTLMRSQDLASGEQAVDMTPELNVRSRVHEYGGGALRTCTDGTAFVVNFSDQNIYRIDRNGETRQLTNSQNNERFADLTVNLAAGWLIAVRELHTEGASEPRNDLVRISLHTGDVDCIASGADFIACPRLSPDNQQLAYVTWDHPNMPWDGSQLLLANLASDGSLADTTVLAGGASESICEPSWRSDGTLFFTSDRSGYWNLWRFDESGIDSVLPDDAEYALPPWQFDTRTVCHLDDRYSAAQRILDGSSELVIIDTQAGLYTPLHSDFSSYTGICHRSDGGGVLALCGREDDTACLASFSASGAVGELFCPSPTTLSPAAIARAEPIRFPARDGSIAHAFYYAPTSAKFRGAGDELPPLMVLSHGGPTASASTSLNYRIQYFTSRGWAVVDVNYGGSTGYGRGYRLRLQDNWGIVDVADCEDAARHLVASGRADAARIAIRGGSAGGYTTLAALCFTSTFRAGASYYGIGDLRALEQDTHKFEARYLDGLVNNEHEARSPIRHVERLNCPVIFFQGSEDRVVPPNQAQAMVDVLLDKGIDVSYLLFEGEGHGFRDAINIKRSIESEYAFLARVFEFEPADDLPRVPSAQRSGER
ncbi:MAG: prolyl oligopeptidase family serine peptidase [Pseudomonadaceae bacterium]|nr:prolyl oligopeptidase family serine peptidase [Pseudomonadaceae bacterium]